MRTHTRTHTSLLHPGESYIFADIEADGPVPGLHSMLSVGACAFDWQGVEYGVLYEKIEPLPDASPHPDTEKWWATLPREIYDEARANPQPARPVMLKFRHLAALVPDTKPVLVANPTHFDAAFLRYYAWRFLDGDIFAEPFTRCMDMHSMTVGRFGGGHRECNRMREADKVDHPHHPLEDARIQARQFFDIARV